MVNRQDIGLYDLLFSTVFGATFSFKLQILHDMEMTMLSQLGEHVAFYAYSIVFVIMYWKWIRPEKKESWLDLIFALVSSLSPYPALQIALWFHGTFQGIYDRITAVVIMIQLLVVVVCIYRKRKQ